MNVLLLAIWLIFLSVFLLVVALDLLRGRKSKLNRYISNSKNVYEFAENLAPFIPNLSNEFSKEELKNKLSWSGDVFGLTVEGYYALKIILGIVGFVIGMFLYPFGLTIAFALFVAFIFFLLPTLMLRRAIDKRQDLITLELPSMVSLLATAVRAGIELGPALETVSHNITGPLGEIMRDAWKEIATGKLRASVLRLSAKNTGVASFERFIDTIVVAEERGGQELSKALMEFSYDMKHMQRQFLEEKAKKVPTKMLLPLMLCIFIPMLILLLAPIVMSVLGTF